jgi:hypothetical protein
MRFNPDINIRELERVYAQEPTLGSGVRLLAGYLRSGTLEDAGVLLDILEPQYPEPYYDLGIESVLVQAHFTLGRDSRDLCEGVVCRYSKPLIWDIMRGYPQGSTQSWIDEISQELVDQGLIPHLPAWYDDRRGINRQPGALPFSTSPDAFHRQKTPYYAIALFHSILEHREDDAFFRVVWNKIRIPEVSIDMDKWFYHEPTFDLMLEDEPALRDYNGPRISLGDIPDMGSHGRQQGASFRSSTHTRRVEVSEGVERAIRMVRKLTSCIYYASIHDERMRCSGTTTFKGTLEDIDTLYTPYE